MNRRYAVIPLVFFGFIGLVTWHWAFAGGCILLAAFIWESTGDGGTRKLIREVERYVNDRDRDTDKDEH